MQDHSTLGPNLAFSDSSRELVSLHWSQKGFSKFRLMQYNRIWIQHLQHSPKRWSVINMTFLGCFFFSIVWQKKKKAAKKTKQKPNNSIKEAALISFLLICSSPICCTNEYRMHDSNSILHLDKHLKITFFFNLAWCHRYTSLQCPEPDRIAAWKLLWSSLDDKDAEQEISYGRIERSSAWGGFMEKQTATEATWGRQ